MSSLLRFRWLGTVFACLYALEGCSSSDPQTSGGPVDAGEPGNGGSSGTGGSGGSAVGGMGGEGDDPGGAGAGGTGTAGAGEGGMSGGSGGAGEGGGTVDPVSVVSAVLPDATLNQDYSFVFEASGGSTEGYVFNLDGGALPRGLALDEDGALSGRPLEGGDFELEVRVTDSDGATAQVTLGLYVRQSRWLTYWNAVWGEAPIPRYSAIDLASDDFVRRDLSGTVPTNNNGSDAPAARFSPDGRYSVHSLFIYGAHVGNEWRLVDFDQLADFDWDDPMGLEPRVVANNFDAELVQMYGPEWSPDSKILTTLALIENAEGDLRLPGRFGWFDVDEVFADPNHKENLHRRLEDTGTDMVDWVSTDTVVYGSRILDENENSVAGPLLKATWEGVEFGAPVELHGSMGQPYGEGYNIHYLNRETKTAVIAQYFHPHCVASIELYNFANDEVVNLGATPLLPSPELDRFAGVFNSTLKIANAANQTLADLGPSDCNLVEWSDDGTMLAWVDTTAKMYKVTAIGANGQWETLPSTMREYAASPERPRFSSDGRWLAYIANNELFVARIDELGIHDEVRISVNPVADTDRIHAYQFSPNGEAIVYAAPGQIAGLDDLYLVDLSGEVPGPSRRISPDLSGFPNDDALVVPDPYDSDEYMERRYPTWSVWTPDSSKVFFVVHQKYSLVGDSLWVVDALAAQPRPRQVDVAICDPSTCGTIHTVLPQPLR